ncbi:MAG: NAD-dependent epimerase/dehydratase family protein [Chloroflexi bacterium]|nr:NAD-dependent epimerase/dehydratase family protein [Chloroflexota bacterium]
MRILIVGGTRFIGPAVVSRLHDLGHELTVFHRGVSEPELPSGVRHLHGDRSRLSDFADQFRRLLPDVVIDMAAFTEDEGTASVAAFQGIAHRLVLISSQDVYRAHGRFHGSEPGPLEPVPYGEETPLRERLYPYRGTGRGLDDYDKILVEHAARSSPFLPCTVLRLPMVYGERDNQRRIALELRRMDDSRPAIVLEETFANWRWTRLYAGNAAAAIARAVTDERAAGRVYNVGDPEALSYAGWVRAIGRAAAWPGEVRVVPDGTLPPQLRPPPGDYRQHLVADTSRIRDELAFYEPVPPQEALRRAIEWERAYRAQRPPRPLDYAAEDAVLAAAGSAFEARSSSA